LSLASPSSISTRQLLHVYANLEATAQERDLPIHLRRSNSMAPAIVLSYRASSSAKGAVQEERIMNKTLTVCK
jgi:hypothetical protein